MSSFNKVILMGNLTRTPELRTIPSGTQVTDITLAINEKYKDQESTHFVDVTFWGKQAETLCRWKKQGDPLLVEGALQQDKWVDKESGKNRSKLKVRGWSFTFIGRPGSGDSGGNQGGGGNYNQGGGNRGGNQGGGNDPSRASGPNGGGGQGGYDDYATQLPNNGGGDEPPF